MQAKLAGILILLAIACGGLARASEGSGSPASSGGGRLDRSSDAVRSTANPIVPASASNSRVGAGGMISLPPADDEDNGTGSRWDKVNRRSSYRYSNNPIAATESEDQKSSTAAAAAVKPDSTLLWTGIFAALGGLGVAMIAGAMLRRRWRHARRNRAMKRDVSWGNHLQSRRFALPALAAKLIEVQHHTPNTPKVPKIAQPETRETRRAA